MIKSNISSRIIIYNVFIVILIVIKLIFIYLILTYIVIIVQKIWNKERLIVSSNRRRILKKKKKIPPCSNLSKISRIETILPFILSRYFPPDNRFRSPPLSRPETMRARARVQRPGICITSITARSTNFITGPCTGLTAMLSPAIDQDFRKFHSNYFSSPSFTWYP